MARRSDFSLDAATGLGLGAREAQEDAVLCDVPQGGAAAILALADGLGGHVSGALASRIAVTTAVSELAGQRDPSGHLEGDVPTRLLAAAEAANHAILTHAERNPETAGMGATLVVAVVQGGALHWISIGDSPLYLCRGGQCRQINEVHSLAPQFDFLARVGEMDPDVAASHPDRSCLTSALGCHPLPRVDCPGTSLPLMADDVLLAASDGILTLSETEIGRGIGRPATTSAASIAATLLRRVDEADIETQDNVSVAVLRANATAPRIRPAPQASATGLLSRLRRVRVLPGELVGALRRIAPAASAERAE